MRDPYQVLGVPSTATDEEVKEDVECIDLWVIYLSLLLFTA